ncbi:immunity 42 family protein [Kosakonia sp. HypNH10]|uniref:immunity 42 family protein n=1 Tax=Kosakonia sp. HypNH10 TaxID=2980101 RepID=UPI002449C518|nr:immunity 42 family protein [Kosakonia sp. HypNH10]MDH2912048.1 immunity 42 family protein [Kosakonia sp. HypNH10]
MIYGDPFIFALQFDVVEALNAPGDTWKNGLFSLYIDGQRLFGNINPVELKTTLGFYSSVPLDKLCVNDSSIDAHSLYQNAASYFTGDGTELIDGLFDMTCTAMEDNDCYLYFMKKREGDLLIWSLDGGMNVSEKILPKNTLSCVVSLLQRNPSLFSLVPS